MSSGKKGQIVKRSLPLFSRGELETQARNGGVAISDHSLSGTSCGKQNSLRRLGDSQFHDVCSLRTFGPFDQVEFNGFALLEGFKAIFLKCRVMDEDILASFHLDKAKALTIIEPFDGALALHDNSSPFIRWLSIWKMMTVLSKKAEKGDVSFSGFQGDGLVHLLNTFTKTVRM